MRFYFHEDAEAEFDRAVEYYEDAQSGLGMELPKRSTLQLHVSFSSLKHGRLCPRIHAAVWSADFPLALFIR